MGPFSPQADVLSNKPNQLGPKQKHLDNFCFYILALVINTVLTSRNFQQVNESDIFGKSEEKRLTILMCILGTLTHDWNQN